MNKYFVYYSATGNGDFIADHLKEKGYLSPTIYYVISKLNEYNLIDDNQYAINFINTHKKTFGKLEVLKDINIDITQGEVLVVIGPSGSGKSTFLRCLNRLETATSGKIIVNGENISDKKININKARENIGMVFQHLPDRTAGKLTPVPRSLFQFFERRPDHRFLSGQQSGGDPHTV